MVHYSKYKALYMSCQVNEELGYQEIRKYK